MNLAVTKSSRLIAVLIAALMVFSLVSFSPEAAAYADNSGAQGVSPTEAESVKYYDGTYSGSGAGYGGNSVSVSVTVSGGAIISVDDTGHSGQTNAYWNIAWPEIANRIIAAQSAEVDAVSSATLSSNGVKDAVGNALRKANALSLIEPGTHENISSVLWNANADQPSMMSSLLASTANLEVGTDGNVYAYLRFVPTVIAGISITGDAVKTVTSRFGDLSETATLISSDASATVFKARVYNVLEPTVLDVFHTGMSVDGGTNTVRLKLEIGHLLPGSDIPGEVIAPDEGDYDDDGVPNKRDYYPRNPLKSYDSALQSVGTGVVLGSTASKTLDGTLEVSQSDLDGMSWNTRIKLATPELAVIVPIAYIDALLAKKPDAKLAFSSSPSGSQTLQAMTDAAQDASAGDAVKGIRLDISLKLADNSEQAIDALPGNFITGVELSSAETDALSDFHNNAVYSYNADKRDLSKLTAYFVLKSRRADFVSSAAGDYLITSKTPEGLPQLNWLETFGGSAHDQFSFIENAADGGYVTAGTSASTDGDMPGQTPVTKNMVVKYSSQDKLEWICPIGTVNVLALASLPEGGYIAAGRANAIPGGFSKGTYDAALVKISEAGRIEYMKSFGSSGVDEINSIVAVGAGFTVLGSYGAANFDFSGMDNQGSSDSFAFTYDKDGNLLREASWGGSSADTVVNAIGVDDGILVSGSTSSSDGIFRSGYGNSRTDAYLLKLSGQGEVEWARCFGGSGVDIGAKILNLGGNEYLFSVSFSPDNDGMYKDKNKGSTDIAFHRVNAEGDVIWSSFIGDTGNDVLARARLDKDGNILALINSLNGGTGDFADVFYEDQYRSYCAFVRLDIDSGELLYKTRFRATDLNDQLADFIITDDGGILSVGRNSGSSGVFEGLNYDPVVNDDPSVAKTNDATLVKFDGTPKTASKTVLSALIASASSMTDPGKPVLSAALSEMLVKAEKTRNNPYASQKTINDVVEQLRGAMDAFDGATEVNWTGLTANGVSGTENTTELTLTFDADPGALQSSGISVSGATSWEISGSGNTRTLAVAGLIVNNATSLTVNIFKKPDDVLITPASKTFAVNRSPEINWTVTAADGKPGEKDTTALKIEVDNRPVGMTINHITVDGATKGTLYTSDMTYFIPISDIAVSDGGILSVSITNTAIYSFVAPTKTVVVHKAQSQPAPDTRAPVLSAPNVNRSGDWLATLGFRTDEDGTARYLVLDKGLPAPTSATVAEDGNNLGNVPSGAVSKQILLSPGEKDAYVTVTDASGNVGTPMKIEIGAYTGERETDKNNLDDGDYSVGIDLFKTNRSDKSMADGAISHTAKLTVSGGAYYLTFDMHSLTVGTIDGYLSRLNYYDPATYDGSGNPNGVAKAAIVLSYHTNADGSYVTDAYNDASNPYPKQLMFPLTDKAGYEDDFVPMQVFVPIMAVINPSGGTQDMLMKIDWTTLKSATDEDFKDDDGEANKTALSVKIAEAASISQGNKSAAAYAALQSAITAACTAIGKTGATQAEINAAMSALAAAVATFNGSADNIADNNNANENVNNNANNNIVNNVDLNKSQADNVVTSLSTLNITAADKVWTGQKIASGFALTAGGKKLTAGTDYTVAGTGANKNIGAGTVQITGAGGYKDTVTVKFRIVPKAVSVKSVKPGKRSLTIKWAKAPKAEKITRYEVRWKVKGTKSWKSKAVSPAKTTLAVKKLKKGKKYEVQTRVYKTVGGTKYYSAWSKVKTGGKVK
jgi:uncharacterized protein with FMN-binding domain